MSQKKGNKKDKHNIATIALVTAIISLIGQIIDLINKLANWVWWRERNLPLRKKYLLCGSLSRYIWNKLKGGEDYVWNNDGCGSNCIRSCYGCTAGKAGKEKIISL